MKTMRKFLLLALLPVLLSSCYSMEPVSMQNDYERMFVGQSYNTLVQMCGAPDRTVTDGNDGQILIYEQHTTQTTAVTSYASRYYTPTRVTTNTSTSFMELFVNKDKICYGVRTNHVKYRREYDKGATWGLIGASVATVGLIIWAVIAADGDDE